MQDNAEGSPKFSDREQAVLVGTLLGDGCLAKHGRYHRLHIKHKATHLPLVEFKYEVFRRFVSMPLHEFDQKLGGQQYPCIQFATRTSPSFTEWAFRFYRDGRKTVPEEIACYLTPLAFAVWFMDDGAADYAGVTLQTHSFTKEEVELLKETLRNRYEIDARPRRNKGGLVLYICAADMPKLRVLLEANILPEFRYKLVPRRERTP